MPVRKARGHTTAQNALLRGSEIWPYRMYMFVLRSSLGSKVGEPLLESKLRGALKSGKACNLFAATFSPPHPSIP